MSQPMFPNRRRKRGPLAPAQLVDRWASHATAVRIRVDHRAVDRTSVVGTRWVGRERLRGPKASRTPFNR